VRRHAGDPGLFGPGSVAWRIDREVIVLAGGSCALLLQAAHPAVAAAVEEHSSYRNDPFGRLSRTLSTSFAVVFGTSPAAHRAIARVNQLHRSIRGRIPETGRRYTALDPRALLWVHASLVDTAIRVYDRFVEPLSNEEADAYHREAAPVATALGVPERLLPATLDELRSWMEQMVASGEVTVTPTARRIAEKVLYPTRFPPPVAWDAAHLVSLATLRPDLRAQYGLPWGPGRERAVRLLASTTRRVLPLVPPPLRYVPQARAAMRRVSGSV
jgi:uncharacterized protein (DUF2236 family)